MLNSSMAANLVSKWFLVLTKNVRGSSAPLHHKLHTYSCRRHLHDEKRQAPVIQPERKEVMFEHLLSTSRFVSCGESPVGQKALGKIIEEVEGDLYIDFGAKFHAVVPRPKKRGPEYRKGRWVEVVIEDLEISEHFLGESKDTSLLEAQVRLIGLTKDNR